MHKKRAIVFCIVLWVTIALFAQDSIRIDSLNRLLQTQPKKEKVNTYIALANEYSAADLHKALDYIDNAISLSRELKDKKGEGNAFYRGGVTYNMHYEDAKALEYFRRSYKIRQAINDENGLAEVLNSLGLSMYYLAEYDSAHIYLRKALTVAGKIRNNKELANSLYNLGNIYNKKSMLDTAFKYYRQALQINIILNDKSGIGKCYNSIGVMFFNNDKYDSAIAYYHLTSKIKEETGDKRGQGITLNNIGNVYWRWSKYDDAIDYYQRASKIFEQIGYKQGIASCLNNIGLIMENMVKGELNESNLENYNKARDFHLRALKVREELGNDLDIAGSLNNLGTVLFKIQEARLKSIYGIQWNDSILKQKKTKYLNGFDTSYNYYSRALTHYKKINNKPGIASILNNIGRIYFTKGNYSKALQQFQEGLELAKSLNNQYEIGLNLFQIGVAYMKQGQYNESLDYLYQSLDIGKKIKFKEICKSAYENISEVYELMGDYKNSLKTYKSFISVRDSIFNEENYKTMSELQTKYDTEKKDLALKQAAEKDTLNSKIIRQQKFILYAVVLILLIIAGFLVLVFRQNSQIKKQNNLLEEQNDLISKQHKEIKDSIHYAQRIQRAIIPPGEPIDQLIPERFILWRPRDIVSGDFYWIARHHNRAIVVAADCTGHGVPGAFMSMLGVTFLNEIVAGLEELHADIILNTMRQKIIDSLHQTGKIGESQDGMDMALYIFDKEKMIVEYAGANNPLILVRKGEVIPYKADKMPVGIHIKAKEPFTNNLINVEPGDCLYTFSDGYQDQFGGPDTKKFMIKNLKELLGNIYTKHMDEQRQILEKTIVDWMGKDHEQIDDILLLGVRIPG